MGDFSWLQEVPEMYRHCKATEDRDMTAFDFITDHLINIDGVFDHHRNGDEQKPHTPLSFQHHAQTELTVTASFVYGISDLPIPALKPLLPALHFHSSGYHARILRPPIA